MDPRFIEGLIAIVERSGIVELEYSEHGARVRITKSTAGTLTSVTGTEVEVPPAPSAQESPNHEKRPSGHVIAAGLVGTFYRSPAPGKPPFVSVGDQVEEGQTLGILEAMKMLNPIEADCAGRIEEVFQEDSASVQVGTALFVIAPAS